MRAGLLRLATSRGCGFRIFERGLYTYLGEYKSTYKWTDAKGRRRIGLVRWCYGDKDGYIDKMRSSEVREDFGIPAFRAGAAQ